MIGPYLFGFKDVTTLYLREKTVWSRGIAPTAGSGGINDPRYVSA
jgi:hypothetical protein